VNTAYKTGILEYVVLLLLLRTQISKGVDDYAEYQVENDDDEDKEEQ